jgi:hypothetical protein
MLRIRLTSFLVGFGVASGLALYQLRQDIFRGHDFLAAQVRDPAVIRPRAARCRRRCEEQQQPWGSPCP